MVLGSGILLLMGFRIPEPRIPESGFLYMGRKTMDLKIFGININNPSYVRSGIRLELNKKLQQQQQKIQFE